MKRAAQYAMIAGVGIVAALAGFMTRQGATPPVPQVAANAGETLFALQLPDVAGTLQPIAQWRGKVVVANFWATWCAPCRKEIPDFAAVSARYADAPVQFVGISIDQRDNVEKFAREYSVPYPLLIGSAQTLQLASALGNAAQALPFTVILDRHGAVHRVKLGTLNQAELEGTIRALLSP